MSTSTKRRPVVRESWFAKPPHVIPLARGFVDWVVVERILGGDYHVPATAPERAEVCRRWVAAGGSLSALARETGWRVSRYARLEREAS